MPGHLIYISGKSVLHEKAGGSTSYVRTFARAATMAGYHVHLFAVGPRREVIETDFGTHHLVTSWSCFPNRSPYAWFHSPVLAAGMIDFAQANPGPLLLHGHSNWTCAGSAALPRLRKMDRAATLITSSYTFMVDESQCKLDALDRNAPWQTRMHARVDLLMSRCLIAPAERRYHRQVRLILINYLSVQRILERWIGRNLPFRMFPYSVEFSGEPPLSKKPSDGVVRIAMLSRHDPRKGVDVLVRALAVLKKRGVPFRATLMGPGNLLNFHRELARQLGLDENDAALPGFVAEAQQLLAESDIYVLPSIREHSGSMSLLEAMRLGVAPVASDCDGIGEDIRDGENGLLVKPGDPVALADAIERLVRDPDLRTRLGRAARVTFEERFSLQGLAVALRELYTELGFPPTESAASSRAT